MKLTTTTDLTKAKLRDEEVQVLVGINGRKQEARVLIYRGTVFQASLAMSLEQLERLQASLELARRDLLKL